MTSIPANELVNISPSVLGAGGDGVNIIGLVLTNSARAPVGSVIAFPDGASVSNYFGPGSIEAQVANGGTNFGTGYFGGFTGSSKQPGSILFAQYNQTAVAAYLRGGSVAALSLAQLQAINGTLTVTVDSVPLTAPALNLAGATSFSNGAAIIQSALQASAPAGASFTGSIGGVVTGSIGATFTSTGSGTNMTASAVVGVLRPGCQISGTGVPAGTYIVSQTSGTTGAAGVYVTNNVTTSVAAALTATSNVLDVTAVTSGTLQATDVISGTNVTVGTVIGSQLTGSPGGIGTYAIGTYQQAASTTITSLSSTLNVTAVSSGSIIVGALLAGTNITANTLVTSQKTGTGGVGTYGLSKSSTTVSETITTTAVAPLVTYDSLSGAFIVTSGTTGATSTVSYGSGTTADALNLGASDGAVLSQGAAAAVPAAFMDALIVQNPNWATFFTTFDPDVSGSSVKQAFAAWKNSQNNRYAYLGWDLDVTPTNTLPATTSLGAVLAANQDSGTCLLDGDPASGWNLAAAVALAAFIAGAAASIDFTQTRGRISFAYKAQAGLLATVTTPKIANNLAGDTQTNGSRGNGYNFYGAYGNANANFTWFQRGFVTGPFKWLDSYINQIWLNNALQNALLVLQQNSLSIPYSNDGNALIESALADPIQAGLNFGAFGPGNLSSTQIAQVNASAGAKIASTLQTQGYYLQILPATAQTRAGRTSPPAKFWYIDQGSVQAISLSSVALS